MTTAQTAVRVSTSAAARINAITSNEATNKLLRLSVEG